MRDQPYSLILHQSNGPEYVPDEDRRFSVHPLSCLRSLSDFEFYISNFTVTNTGDSGYCPCKTSPETD